jgi:hypothetical protein
MNLTFEMKHCCFLFELKKLKEEHNGRGKRMFEVRGGSGVIRWED